MLRITVTIEHGTPFVSFQTELLTIDLLFQGGRNTMRRARHGLRVEQFPPKRWQLRMYVLPEICRCMLVAEPSHLPAALKKQ